MPYRTEWVAPELFMEHGGVHVFHAYKDGEIDAPMEYWYTLSYESDDESFDVRGIDAPENLTSHEEIIRYAIDNKLLQD